MRKFRARSLTEAVAQVKAELGPEAVILQTAHVKVGGFFGLFGHTLIEVTAAADPGASQPAPAPAPAERSAPVAPAPAVVAAASQPVVVAPEPRLSRTAMLSPAPAEDKQLAAVKSEMESMKAMMGLMLDRIQSTGEQVALEPDLKELHDVLIGGGVEDSIAMNLVTRVRECLPRGKGSLAQAKAVVRDLMLADLGAPVTVRTDGQERTVVALVGSTGVGKTTTLAKLAAHFALGKRLRVGLITADTYRVAAVEQLRTYSDILGVPLEVVYDPTELPGALAKMQSRDVILVDTAGRSHRNPEHMNELQVYMEMLRPNEIYLTLSLTASYKSSMAAVQHYLPLGVQRMIYTKWDEAEAPGLIYNLTHEHRLPLSYITNGQNVPDDIEIANPESIIRAIIGD